MNNDLQNINKFAEAKLIDIKNLLNRIDDKVDNIEVENNTQVSKSYVEGFKKIINHEFDTIKGLNELYSLNTHLWSSIEIVKTINENYSHAEYFYHECIKMIENESIN